MPVDHSRCFTVILGLVAIFRFFVMDYGVGLREWGGACAINITELLLNPSKRSACYVILKLNNFI